MLLQLRLKKNQKPINGKNSELYSTDIKFKKIVNYQIVNYTDSELLNTAIPVIKSGALVDATLLQMWSSSMHSSSPVKKERVKRTRKNAPKNAFERVLTCVQERNQLFYRVLTRFNARSFASFYMHCERAFLCVFL